MAPFSFNLSSGDIFMTNQSPKKFPTGKVFLFTFLCLNLVLIGSYLIRITTEPEPPETLETYAEIVIPPKIPPMTWKEGSFASSRPFYNQLLDAGLKASQVHKVIDTLTPVYDFRRAHPKHSWRLGFQEEVAKTFTLKVSPAVIYDVNGLDSDLKLVQRDIETYTVPVVVRGTLESSLFKSLSHEENSPALASKLSRVFAWDIDFYQDPRKGDTFELLIEKNYIASEEGPQFNGWGKVLAARYHQSKHTYTAYKYQQAKGEETYFDASGQSVVRDFLRSPLKLTRVTSSFKKRRFHPVLKRYKAHNGVDYGAPTGTPVMAVANGKVTVSGRYGGAGIAVVLKHSNKMETQYFHLSRIAKGIRKGGKVKQGQIIGYVGQTGYATGPHLHFGMKVRGKYVNPQRQKFSPGTPIRKDRREAFDTVVTAYDKILGEGLENAGEALNVVRLKIPQNHRPQ